MTLLYANVMWACVRDCECVCIVVVWQGPMEEQFLYGMDFTLYKHIWNKFEKYFEDYCHISQESMVPFPYIWGQIWPPVWFQFSYCLLMLFSIWSP